MSSPARRLVALAAVPLLVLAACGDDDDGEASAGASAGGDPIEVVAAFYPVAEAAEQVGGDLVEVTNLTPAGTEPHDLELTPDQVDDIEDADVVLYVGQGFQPAVADAAGRRGDDQVTLDVLDGIALEPGASEALESEEGDEHSEEGGEEGDEHSEEALDPHFWLDPQLMRDAVDEIEAALGDAEPADAEAFGAGAQRYGEELAALDQEIETGLSGCERDEIVTSHAAFYYLANRYGLTQLPIAGLSPEAEPDADRLAELADRVEEDGITTVFYEDLVSPDVAETLASEAGVETARLSPLEGLTEEQVDAGDDYLSVMRQNLAALQEALGCTS